MSASSDDAVVECEPESSRSSVSGGSTRNVPTTAATTATSTIACTTDLRDHKNPPSARIEKTISCVSCRKRKLKCDRAKPKCGTCTRLRHECEYPERRRHLGSKRGNIKELEARLAQVETQLVAETVKASATAPAQTPAMTEPDWNNFATMDMDMNIDMENAGMLDEPFNVPLSAFGYQQPTPNAPPGGNFFSQELVSLGLSESLPPQEMIDELHQIYFDKCHPTIPMIHKYRYLSALNLPAHMQPAVYLRYALWATAACVSDKYRQYEDVLYERARKYLQDAEMKGYGETFVTIQFAQAWSLVASYEAMKTYFTRAWMSTGRTTRFTHMLGLHRLDGDSQDIRRVVAPAKDWVELEERRRIFWAAFYGDRWASSGTGWPMSIDEAEIQTNLPCSEEAYYSGIMEEAPTLSEALTPEGASRLSPFGGVVISACLFGHNFQHLHKTGPDEHPEDLANGEFWKRHRKMDNVLSNTFMFLPDHLRLPQSIRDLNVVFLNMNIHASAICLHQAAVLTAEKNNVSQSFIRQSRNRSLMAAEEIVNTMRLVSHFDLSHMNSWMGFCLYVAAGVFIQDQKADDSQAQSKTNLEFLFAAMQAVGSRHSITNHFCAQLELDMETNGIQFGRKPNTPMNGILPSREGAPTSVEDLRSFWEPATDDIGKHRLRRICPYVLHMAQGGASFDSISRQPQTTKKIIHPPPEGLRDEHVHPSYPNWVPPASSALSNPLDHNIKHKQQRQAALETSSLASSDPPLSTEPNVATTGASPFNVDPFLASNTPLSHSPSSRTTQVPHRSPGSSNYQSADYSMFQASDPGSFLAASDWNSDMPLNADQFDSGFNSHHNPRELQATDTVRQFFSTESWGENPGG